MKDKKLQNILLLLPGMLLICSVLSSNIGYTATPAVTDCSTCNCSCYAGMDCGLGYCDCVNSAGKHYHKKINVTKNR